MHKTELNKIIGLESNLFFPGVVAGQRVLEGTFCARVFDRSFAEMTLQGRKPILELPVVLLAAGRALAHKVVLAPSRSTQ